MTDEAASAHEATGLAHGKLVAIFVNEGSIEVAGPRTTGLAIKEAAIRAGLPIDPGFQLIEELPHGRTRVVGDEDVIEVRTGSRFLAIAPDDNS
jgi:Multiubiquitin